MLRNSVNVLVCLLAHLGWGLALGQDNPELSPKEIEQHPRLAPLPAIHFDHFNTSVTDYSLPAPGQFTVDARELDSPTGICLNFTVDAEGRIFGFCGESRSVFGWDAGALRVAFYAVAFDDELRITDRFKLRTLKSIPIALGELPPLNLGYFVLDNRGRLIVVKDKKIIFLGRTAEGKLYKDEKWDPKPQIKDFLDSHYSDLDKRKEIANQKIAQVVPDYDNGYWYIALGKYRRFLSGEVVHDVPAYLAKLSNTGVVQYVHVFPGEIIENGLAIDSTGPYVLTDYRLYRFVENDDGSVEARWQEKYDRATKWKKGTLSEFGSGSTPTLIGDDLVAITDNAEDQDNFNESQVNLIIRKRSNGDIVCKVPLFQPGRSANENTVVAYRNSVIVQNWYNSPSFKGSLEGLEPGLERININEDRTGCKKQWVNKDFASTSTIRLSTDTGMLYAGIQVELSEVADDPLVRAWGDAIMIFSDHYAMGVVDFESGKVVEKAYFGSSRSRRLSMAPAYVLPDGRLIQPIRRGFVIFTKNNCESLADGWVTFFKNNQWNGKSFRIGEVAIPGVVEDFQKVKVGKGVSSVRWCLPSGVEFHAFSKPFLEQNGALVPHPEADTYEEIKGTGVIEQADLRYYYPEFGNGGRHPMQDNFVSGWFVDERPPAPPSGGYPGIASRTSTEAKWAFGAGMTFAGESASNEHGSIVARRKIPLPKLDPRIRAVPEVRVPIGNASYKWMAGINLEWTLRNREYDWYVSAGAVVAEPDSNNQTFDDRQSTWTASVGVEGEFGHFPTPFFVEVNRVGEDKLYDYSILLGARF